jgi:hypothetical protein
MPQTERLSKLQETILQKVDGKYISPNTIKGLIADVNLRPQASPIYNKLMEKIF